MADLTLEIVIPEAAVPRVRAAYQRLYGLDALPTKEQVETFLRRRIRQMVRTAELDAALEGVPEPPDLEL